MILDKGLLKQVQQTFQQVNCGLLLLDEDGADVLRPNGEAYPLPEKYSAAHATVCGEYAFLPVSGSNGLLLAIRKNADGAQAILSVAEALVRSLMLRNGDAASDADVYLRAMKQELTGDELGLLAREHQVETERPRCAIVFSVLNTENGGVCRLLGEVIPRSEEDVLLEVDRHQVVLIKDMTNVEDEEELYQFVRAADETVLSETALQPIIGVGQPRATLGELWESYREACQAIEIGRAFRTDEHIFPFGHMLLERFLMELPQDVSAYYHSLLFNRRTSRLLNEEMLTTIQMFFKKDLNLSDTARQLFIHRNTLVYRLEKVQRVTGLDLRRFDDAVTFKILMELKKSGADKPRQLR